MMSTQIIILMIGGIVFIVAAIVIYFLPIGGKRVKCPHCGNTTTVKGEGIFRCYSCQSEFSWGKITKIAVTCPYCKKVTHVDGPGIYACSL
jgi:DNA-directed RNA polymerase subunit RPC12/RpoP